MQKTDPADVAGKFFGDAKKARKYLDLTAFEPFADTADAVAAASAMVEGQASASLAKFLKRQLKKESAQLAVSDKNLAQSLKTQMGRDLEILHSEHTNEVFRGIRLYMKELPSSCSEGEDKHPFTMRLSRLMVRGVRQWAMSSPSVLIPSLNAFNTAESLGIASP